MIYIYGVLALVAAIIILGTAYALVVDGARREEAEKAALRMTALDAYMRHLESREKAAAADLLEPYERRSWTR